MIRLNPPKKRPRQQPVRKGQAVQYNRDLALLEAGEKERKASEKRAAAAEKFLQPISKTTETVAEQVKEAPFTGQAYQEAAESQRQEKVQKWHDINTGFEAALMAQLGADLGVPLIKGGLKWLKNKAVSPAAKTMMNPENFTFEGPLIKPAKLNIAEEPIAEEPLGSISQTLFLKPRLSLPQPKQRLGLPMYNAKASLDIPTQDAGLYDITDGDLAGIRLADTALKPKISISPHNMPSYLMEHHTGNSVNRVVDNIYSVWNRNYPLWELEGIKPPLPFIASIGDNVMSVGFRPQWYKMIETPGELERMTSFAGPTRNKLIANLSPEARDLQRARDMQPIDLFDEWLGPEARSPQQIAIDDEINAFNKRWEDRLLFDTNVNNLSQNGLITPRHRQALLNSDDPLKYFNGAAQHNIMKKATQQYFKDIKAVKQKDYARRVMQAREEESLANAGLNDRANAVYSDLQGTIQPPSSLNRQIADAENAIGKIRSIGDIVNETMNNYRAWKADPNPAGWQLKPLMEGNKLERQLSKDGTIAVSNLRNGIKDASGVEKQIIEKVLSEKFAGQTKVNYADLKHAVQEELPVYNHERTHGYESYGLNRLGFDQDTIQLDTYTFSSPRIPHGNNRHYSQNTLGHSRTYTSKEEPDVMHVMESQSDWGQQYKHLHQEGTADAELERVYERLNDKTHSEYLANNWESRQIQENMMHAANKGLTKMRYPTSDTAAKIEGYSKNSYTEEYENLLTERDVLINRNGNILDKTGKEDPSLRKQIDELQERIEQIRNSGNYEDYPKQHKTILRKYSEFPKKFKKIYKNSEVREVTDSKGNTWYEVDVPKNLRKRERAYGITGTIVAGGTAASTLKPRKNDKK